MWKLYSTDQNGLNICEWNAVSKKKEKHFSTIFIQSGLVKKRHDHQQTNGFAVSGSGYGAWRYDLRASLDFAKLRFRLVGLDDAPAGTCSKRFFLQLKEVHYPARFS